VKHTMVCSLGRLDRLLVESVKHQAGGYVVGRVTGRLSLELSLGLVSVEEG